MDQLCAAAEVSKRTAYQHFAGKDELVAEYLRRFDPTVLSGVFHRTDLTPRERLLAAFDVPPTTPLCPYIGAAVELHDPEHPASRYAREYKRAVAARLADTAREAGAADPEQLGEQLALLLDGAAARTRVSTPTPSHRRRHRRGPHRQRRPRRGRRRAATGRRVELSPGARPTSRGDPKQWRGVRGAAAAGRVHAADRRLGQPG
ncbi:hypothetical protein SVIOM342S_06008 [Streptomyces violaceorubidus]